MNIIKSFSIFENVQQAKSILKSKGIPENDSDYLTIRDWFKGSDGYVGWFAKMRYEKEIPMETLKEIYNIIKNSPNIIQGLPNQLLSYDNLEKLQDDLEISKTNIKVKKCYDEFPSLQKKLLDVNDERTRMLLKSLWELKNVEHYFAKVSRYKSKEILLDSIKSFIEGNTQQQDFNSILKSTEQYIRRGYAKLILQDKKHDIIILKAINPEVVSNLGSGTSWCIRNATTFKGYVCDDSYSQFMIWLTDMPVWSQYSLIGLTLSPNGYSTSHLKNDSYISMESLYLLLSERGINIKLLYSESVKKENVRVAELKYVFKLSEDEIIDIKGGKLLPNECKLFSKEKLDKHGIKSQFYLSVKELDDFGYSRDEIFKNKKSYIFIDAEIISKDDIKRIGFDKFDLPGLLSKFSIPEIFKDRKEIKDSQELQTIVREKGFEIIVDNDLTLDNIGISYNGLVSKNFREIKWNVPKEYILTHKNKWEVSDLSLLLKDEIKDIIKRGDNISGVVYKEFKDSKSEDVLNREEIIKEKYYKKLQFGVEYLASLDISIDDVKKYSMDIAWNLPYKGNEYPKKKPEGIIIRDGKGNKEGDWRVTRDFMNSIGWGSSSRSESVSNKSLIKLISFYNMHIEETMECYKLLNSKNYQDIMIIFDELSKKGIDFHKNGESELIKTIEEVSDRSRSDIRRLKLNLFIKYDLDVKSLLNSFIENQVNYNELESDLDKLSEKGLDKKIHKVKQIILMDEIRSRDLIKRGVQSMGWHNGTRGRDEGMSLKEIKEIYDFYEKEKTKLDEWIPFKPEYSGYSDEDKAAIIIFFTYVKLDKLEDFDLPGYDFSRSTFIKILRHLCNAWRANSRDCVGIKLEHDEKLRAYNWLKKNCFRNDDMRELPDILPVTYEFDRPLFEKLCDTLLKSESIEKHYASNGKLVERSLVFNNFIVFFNYLISNEYSKKPPIDIKEVEKEANILIQKILGATRTKLKRIQTLKAIKNIHVFSASSERKKIIVDIASELLKKEEEVKIKRFKNVE